jgi:hypothetical protein
MQFRSFTAAVLTASTLLIAAFSATAAGAKPQPPGPPPPLTLPAVVAPCAGTLTGITATCAGYYDGNLNNGGNIGNGYTNSDLQLLALQSLGYSGDLNSVKTPIQKLENLSGTSLNFDQMLYGITYISIHFGNGKGGPSDGYDGKSVTGFFKFDAGTDGIDILGLNFKAVSNAVLYSTGPKPPCIGRECGGDNDGVPEPATWLMMIMGFGGVGAVMRRRRHTLTFA